jgi:pilus assembly protein CpaC
VKTPLLIKCSTGILLLAGLFAANPNRAIAQAASSIPTPAQMDIRDTSATDTLHIVVGRSMVLRGVSPLKRIYIGNPNVLQSFTAGPSEIVLTAKAPGISSLAIWDTLGQSRLYTVAIDIDSDFLRQSLLEAFPSSHIDVAGREGRIYLSGTVPTQLVSDGAAKLAAAFSTGVVNSLLVVPVHGKQVQLKLRIVEIDRTKMEQYGINISGLANNNPFSVTTGQFPSTITSTPASGTTPGSVVVSDAMNLFLYSTKLNFGATVKDLEQKQILQVLAEPTLTALSGESAKFLSGGEFPYPIAEASTGGGAPVISISFRPYGVKVEFTPTVNSDGTIRLKVSPEVSTLDFTNAVSISGFTVPALSTRRAETEVEIKSGQSFALSGLLDRRTTETLSQIPGISKIPILGKLFVTKSYTNSIVELVVMVTATVVDPLTDTVPTADPKFVVPLMDVDKFDTDLGKQQNLQPKKP